MIVTGWPGLTSVKLFVMSTLHRSVLPPPQAVSLHCVTAMTGSARTVGGSDEHNASGSPAAPWHSRTVTVAEPPSAAKVLTIVTSQMTPRPGVLSIELLHVVVELITVAADAGDVMVRDAAASSARAERAVTRNMSTRGEGPAIRVLVLDIFMSRPVPLDIAIPEQRRPEARGVRTR
jgi:hypothetical protein